MKAEKRYPITCPYCGAKQYSCKSIAHDLGLVDKGIGNCTECENLLHLIFDEERQEMKAERMEW